MDFISWIGDFFNLIVEIFQGTCEALSNLVTTLTDVADQIKLQQFQQDFVIAKTLGAIRYILGDTLYTCLFISITLGALFSIYKIVIAITKLIKTAKENKPSASINLPKLLKP